jgi:hypothetical protein
MDTFSGQPGTPLATLVPDRCATLIFTTDEEGVLPGWSLNFSVVAIAGACAASAGVAASAPTAWIARCARLPLPLATSGWSGREH